MTSELKEGLSESRPMEEKEFLWLRHDPNWLLAMDFYRMAAIMQ